MKAIKFEGSADNVATVATGKPSGDFDFGQKAADV